MKKTGTIESLNVSPKGSYEGFVLREGKKVVQINLPKHDHEMARSLEVGKKVTVEANAEEMRGEPIHEVFRLVSLAGKNGKAAGGDEHGAREFAGQVERLNYALHGEVNGCILDSGDFLHLKPEGARTLKLQVGMKVKGRGRTKPMVDGHSVIEAESVNGVKIEQHKAKKKNAPQHGKH